MTTPQDPQATPSDPVNTGLPTFPAQPSVPGNPPTEPQGQLWNAGRPGGAPVPGQWVAPAPQVSHLPETSTEYHMFWRTTSWKWWRPLLALLLACVVYFVVINVLVMIVGGIDIATGRLTPEDMADIAHHMTPLLFLANNLSLALLIPIAWLSGFLLFKQSPKWLSSVVGGFRWPWFWMCTAVTVPIWVIVTAVETWLMRSAGDMPELGVNSDTVLLVIGILVTTPLQAAGEEFGLRGLMNRAVASFFRKPVVALVVGGILSSLLFMVIHGAQDIWLNIFYFWFGMVACWLTWRTGGLEAAVAIHVVNNLVSEIFLPFMDISLIFDRSAGTSGPEIFIRVGILVLTAFLIGLLARRREVVRSFRTASIVPDEQAHP
ncbi:CPBP family intramembrane glutamic endopeptidase [Propionibacterium sp. oral taxon 192]|uniref:CPBP family intramembrane glutamic endopeptidase n=1 Tax=Propionibacterium sp. oral taxon 192 TaxID=671222 RepID=UPI0012EBC11F|nr:CPBP family intramembrane glutamic endopeptidase [Propionibacterium sp. oral taxon 192]